MRVVVGEGFHCTGKFFVISRFIYTWLVFDQKNMLNITEKFRKFVAFKTDSSVLLETICNM